MHRLPLAAISALFLAGCASSPAALARLGVANTIIGTKSARATAACAAEIFTGDSDLRGDGNHWWILRTGDGVPYIRWDFRDRPEGGVIAEGRKSKPLAPLGSEKVERCAR